MAELIESFAMKIHCNEFARAVNEYNRALTFFYIPGGSQKAITIKSTSTTDDSSFRIQIAGFGELIADYCTKAGATGRVSGKGFAATLPNIDANTLVLTNADANSAIWGYVAESRVLLKFKGWQDNSGNPVTIYEPSATDQRMGIYQGGATYDFHELDQSLAPLPGIGVHALWVFRPNEIANDRINPWYTYSTKKAEFNVLNFGPSPIVYFFGKDNVNLEDKTNGVDLKSGYSSGWIPDYYRCAVMRYSTSDEVSGLILMRDGS